MQPPESTEPPAEGRSKKSKSRSAVLRIAIYGSLAAAAAAIYMERRAGQHAQTTGDAWRTVIEQKDRQGEPHLRQSELSGYVVGAPSVARSEPMKSRSSARIVETYTWSGILREYAVDVYLGDVATYIGHGDDWPVLSAEGPYVVGSDEL